MIRGMNPGRSNRFFPSPKRPYLLWGPPSLIFNVHRDSFSGVKCPGLEYDHVTPSSAPPPHCIDGVDNYNVCLTARVLQLVLCTNSVTMIPQERLDAVVSVRADNFLGTRQSLKFRQKEIVFCGQQWLFTA